MRNSGAMEKEGLARSLTFLTEEGLPVNTLITDRHVQIRKYMRELSTGWMGGILEKVFLRNFTFIKNNYNDF